MELGTIVYTHINGCIIISSSAMDRRQRRHFVVFIRRQYPGAECYLINCEGVDNGRLTDKKKKPIDGTLKN